MRQVERLQNTLNLHLQGEGGTLDHDNSQNSLDTFFTSVTTKRSRRDAHSCQLKPILERGRIAPEARKIYSPRRKPSVGDGVQLSPGGAKETILLRCSAHRVIPCCFKKETETLPLFRPSGAYSLFHPIPTACAVGYDYVAPPGLWNAHSCCLS